MRYRGVARPTYRGAGYAAKKPDISPGSLYEDTLNAFQEPPGADPHSGWCGGWGLKPLGYPIRYYFRHSFVTASKSTGRHSSFHISKYGISLDDGPGSQGVT